MQDIVYPQVSLAGLSLRGDVEAFLRPGRILEDKVAVAIQNAVQLLRRPCSVVAPAQETPEIGVHFLGILLALDKRPHAAPLLGCQMRKPPPADIGRLPGVQGIIDIDLVDLLPVPAALIVSRHLDGGMMVERTVVEPDELFRGPRQVPYAVFRLRSGGQCFPGLFVVEVNDPVGSRRRQEGGAYAVSTRTVFIPAQQERRVPARRYAGPDRKAGARRQLPSELPLAGDQLEQADVRVAFIPDFRSQPGLSPGVPGAGKIMAVVFIAEDSGRNVACIGAQGRRQQAPLAVTPFHPDQLSRIGQ